MGRSMEACLTHWKCLLLGSLSDRSPSLETVLKKLTDRLRSMTKQTGVRDIDCTRICLLQSNFELCILIDKTNPWRELDTFKDPES